MDFFLGKQRKYQNSAGTAYKNPGQSRQKPTVLSWLYMTSKFSFISNFSLLSGNSRKNYNRITQFSMRFVKNFTIRENFGDSYSRDKTVAKGLPN